MEFITLCYHEFRDTPIKMEIQSIPVEVANGYQDNLPIALYTDIQDFKEQMQYCLDNDFNFITLEDVEAFYKDRRMLPSKAILLTFDDAYQSMKKLAYPLLKANQIPATMFVVSDWMHEKSKKWDAAFAQTMSWTDLDAMSDCLTTANHTHSMHQRIHLQGSIQTEPKQAVVDDILKCAVYVDAPRIFAYPFGFYDPSVFASLEDANIEFAFTTKPGVNTLSTPRFELKRNIIPYKMPLSAFVELLEKR